MGEGLPSVLRSQKGKGRCELRKPKGGNLGQNLRAPLAPLHIHEGGVGYLEAGVGYLFGLSYLVDPASSHMLVSKIKPCMCKYKLILYCETANGSLNQL